MYVDAEARKKELMAQNEMNGLMFKIEDDPRVTKVGKFIRRTSIDELPQFFDVLRGDMSLVGTRPPTVDEYKQYESHHKRRLSMKPGITGLWQVSGRSDIEDFEEVVKLRRSLHRQLVPLGRRKDFVQNDLRCVRRERGEMIASSRSGKGRLLFFTAARPL